MNLSNLDLNLLVPLDALLRERSVTRAAASLGLSQPSLSSSLARLRKRTEAALVGVERAFATEPGFDPATSQREYRIVASDYPMAVLGGQVGRHLADHAPSLRVRWEHVTDELVARAPDSLRNVDAMVLPHGFVNETPHLDL